MSVSMFMLKAATALAGNVLEKKTGLDTNNNLDQQELVSTTPAKPPAQQPLPEVSKKVQRPRNYAAWPPTRRARWDQENL